MPDRVRDSTFRGSIGGYSVVLTVAQDESGFFACTVEIDGLPVLIRPRRLDRVTEKGDAMQLGLAAVEAYIEGLPRKS
ncbi:hypothetical protein [Stenotrophomonas sp.]|uniref:hypothetical protein n=1 Tax=Stenotrophomonas sp. TaxID=69392 RepID=UPI00289C9AB7|nr:hypothetical protein [Stenotrophomonas sp.]